eukprot:TRINITY_DN1059_c0_g1_i2.p1 TRINITY_DN1059_c0_g1~~TRINITY_DN1059_c0_g1_i2.p1  ORF type:complete len:140 (-),score=35.65 TRINITY_DN1059_c0_g1_i2:53-472(-)
MFIHSTKGGGAATTTTTTTTAPHKFDVVRFRVERLHFTTSAQYTHTGRYWQHPAGHIGGGGGSGSQEEEEEGEEEVVTSHTASREDLHQQLLLREALVTGQLALRYLGVPHAGYVISSEMTSLLSGEMYEDSDDVLSDE